MRTRITILLGLMLLAGAAWAGGRARIVQVQAPHEVTAGQSFRLTFVVRPEIGRRNIEPLVTASSNGRVITIPAVAGRGRNAYTVTIALPAAGEWNLQVDSRFCHTVMEPLTVRAVAKTES
jgi:hypothetical protein